jgi:hypothetical protein
MSKNIKNLINAWNKRPARVEPSEEAHLLYVFTELLPALRDSIPDIVNNAYLVNLAAASPPIPPPAPDAGSQSNVTQPAPAPAPSSHIPEEIPSTGDSGADPGPVADTAGTPAYEAASQPLKPWQKAVAAKRAKALARKAAAPLPTEPQGTDGSATV